MAIPSPLLYDGRGADLPWLQETPDPVTKMTWQSVAEISLETAKQLGVGRGDVLRVETPAGRLEVPALPRGGIRDDVVAIALGQGHTVGWFASHSRDRAPGTPRGVNVLGVIPVLSDEKGGRAYLSVKADLTRTGRFERLAMGQGHDNKRGRQLGEAVTLAALSGHAEAGHGEGHHGSHEIREPYDPADFTLDNSAYRWSLTIDIDRCNGCASCVVACAVENNIPTVGEDQVIWGRVMSWLRIERYVGDGSPEMDLGRGRPESSEVLGHTDIRHSPMLCQHCGAAPCEPVCPVFATYHNPEGLNGMVYNRCIGTRYCANNCPYKVRRFNWYDYQINNWPDPMPLMLNPDVTVRGQGVMEKCTFCVQRIELGRQAAKDAKRLVADGEVKTACQRACPAQALHFGNLKDTTSQVATQVAQNPVRAYHAMHALNTRPGITYLAKVHRTEQAAAHANGEHHS
jgi:molybdopterin-containing oxidoreductase family iron-sulfur binding subunit